MHVWILLWGSYMEPLAPPWAVLSWERWVLSKASWVVLLLLSVWPPRAMRSVVSVTVSLTLSWVDLEESGVISSLASVKGKKVSIDRTSGVAVDHVLVLKSLRPASDMLMVAGSLVLKKFERVVDGCG